MNLPQTFSHNLLNIKINCISVSMYVLCIISVEFIYNVQVTFCESKNHLKLFLTFLRFHLL